MTVWLNSTGYTVNRKRVQRLMLLMGLEGVAPGPQTSRPHPQHIIYPYLLRDLVIDRPNQVWCTDVTDLPMPRGFMFLVAILDWYSRYVLAWMVSNSQDTAQFKQVTGVKVTTQFTSIGATLKQMQRRTEP